MPDFTPCDEYFAIYWQLMFGRYDWMSSMQRIAAQPYFDRSLCEQIRLGFDPSD